MVRISLENLFQVLLEDPFHEAFLHCSVSILHPFTIFTWFEHNQILKNDEAKTIQLLDCIQCNHLEAKV